MPSRRLRDEIDCAGALDLFCDAAVHPGGNTSGPAWQNLARFRGELRQIIGIRVRDFLNLNVVTATGQAAVCLAEIDESLFGFRFHKG